jgi:hypothetical protein
MERSGEQTDKLKVRGVCLAAQRLLVQVILIHSGSYGSRRIVLFIDPLSLILDRLIACGGPRIKQHLYHFP